MKTKHHTADKGLECEPPEVSFTKKKEQTTHKSTNHRVVVRQASALCGFPGCLVVIKKRSSMSPACPRREWAKYRFKFIYQHRHTHTHTHIYIYRSTSKNQSASMCGFMVCETESLLCWQKSIDNIHHTSHTHTHTHADAPLSGTTRRHSSLYLSRLLVVCFVYCRIFLPSEHRNKHTHTHLDGLDGAVL